MKKLTRDGVLAALFKAFEAYDIPHSPVTMKKPTIDEALAIWNAKTESEQVEWIAYTLMNKYPSSILEDKQGKLIWNDRRLQKDWNPLTNWNDFRLVEIKIMEDLELWGEMMEQNHQLPNKRSFDIYSYWKTPLPKRCEALFLAHTSLHPTL